MVSAGGRRMVTDPPGSGAVRKTIVSSTERASMPCIHAGIDAQAASTTASTPSGNKINFDNLRKHFNLHLLAADVVRDILRGHHQAVGSRREVRRNLKLY